MTRLKDTNQTRKFKQILYTHGTVDIIINLGCAACMVLSGEVNPPIECFNLLTRKIKKSEI